MESAEFSNQGLAEIRVRPVERGEEARYLEQMAQHHYLGALAKIGETAWYVATWREQWVAQLSFSAAALKCGVRDRWIEVPISLPSRSGCLNLQPTSVTKLLKHHIFSDDFLSKVIYRLPPPPPKVAILPLQLAKNPCRHSPQTNSGVFMKKLVTTQPTRKAED